MLYGLVMCAMPSITWAALVIDQEGFGPSDGVSGGWTGTRAQSFQPAANNIAGVDIYLYSVAKWIDDGPEIDYTANVSFSLYAASGPEDFGYAANPVLADGTFFLDAGTPRVGWAVFRFAPVPVTPETYYVLQFTTDNGNFGVTTNNTYKRGQTLEPGLERDYFDLHFITYSESTFVPEPATLVMLGLGGLFLLKRRK